MESGFNQKNKHGELNSFDTLIIHNKHLFFTYNGAACHAN